MNGAEQRAYEKFLEHVEKAKPLLDGCVPVGIIFMPATLEPGGVFNIDLEGQGRIIWPIGVPVGDRGKLLLHLARGYITGTVLR